MAEHLPTPWLARTSVEPQLMVNRAADLRRISRLLDDQVASGTSGLYVVRGDRGVGKSIFGRAALAQLAERHPTTVIPVVVDNRGNDRRELLRTFIRRFLESAPKVFAVADRSDAYERAWLQPLRDLLFAGDRLVHGRNRVEARETRNNVDADIGLWPSFNLKFGRVWVDRSEQGQRVESVLEITDEVLRGAIVTTLEHVARDFRVVAFFDDVDQAVGMDRAEHAKLTLRVVLDLEPCITVVHLRTEVVFSDWRREVKQTFRISGLSPEDLRQMVETRVEKAPGPHTEVLQRSGARDPIERMIRATDNPLVLLTWLQTLADQHEVWPPPPGWDQPAALQKLAIEALNGPELSTTTLTALGKLLDTHHDQEPLSEAQLLSHLSAEQLAFLERYELLFQKDRYDRRQGLCVDPLLSLVRPSVAARIRA